MVTETALVQKEGNDLSAADTESILLGLSGRTRDDCSYEDAFAKIDNFTVDQYWNRKKRFPEQVQLLHEEAHEVIRRERLDRLVSFAGRQMERTIDLRESAAEALVGSIEELARIARGDDKVVTNAKGQEKRIVAYPRDVTRAVEMLLKIAQGGVVLLEENEMFLLPHRTEEVVEKETLLPLLPQSVGIHFTSVAVPPGSTVAIEAPSAEVFEGEIVDIADRSDSDTVPGHGSP